MEWKKNQEAQVEITGVTAQGAGVGRLEGLAVFVPLSVPILLQDRFNDLLVNQPR